MSGELANCSGLVPRAAKTRQALFFRSFGIEPAVPLPLFLVLSLSGEPLAVRPVLLQTLASSLDRSRVTLAARELGPYGIADLDALSRDKPVVFVEWSSPTTAKVRVAVSPAAWVERQVRFSKRDPLRERARTVAFSIAAMVPQWKHTALEPQPAPPVAPLVDEDFARPPAVPPEPVEPPPSSEAVDAGLPTEVAAASDAGVPAVEALPEVVSEPPASAPASGPAPVTWWAAASGLGAVPLAGGAGLEGGLCLGGLLCLGAEVSLLTGPLALVAAQQLQVAVGALAEARVRLWSRLRALARLVGGVQWLEVTRGGEARARVSPWAVVEVGAHLEWGRVKTSLACGPAFAGPVRLVVNGQPSELSLLSGRCRVTVGVSW